ncbi:WbwB [Escherichia coli]|nr:glycosyltransferase [Escherichia coli]EFF1817473.1 glycosyltransferase [Escherichia coli]ELQ9378392.1 glycosyltransferase [Escherichia coli]MCF3238088.1 glycosyltransferase [Escherichia coli]MCO0950236.1 glycosyltransferase [Escherichia coli]MDC8967205.1 glycosyltransferase [Escherichia coli]
MDVKNKKITIFISSLRPGGAEGVCVTVANGLVKLGWDVTIVVLNMIRATHQQRLDTSINIVNLNCRHAREAIFPIWRFLSSSASSNLLVFNHQLAIILVLIRIFTRKNYIIISRNINTLSVDLKNAKNFWHKHIVSFLIKRFYSKVEHIIAQSHGMKDDLINFLNINASKISVIHNPVNPYFSDFAKAIKWNDYDKDGFILCVGRLERQKAFHFAVDIFSKVAEKRQDLNLFIIGEGSLRQELEDYVSRLKVTRKVKFLGLRNDLEKYYSKASVVLLTSLYEGFPNVLVESLTLGTPVVAFDCPNGPNEIINSNNGLLVNYKDVNDGVEKLNKALSQEWDYVEIAKAASIYSEEYIVNIYSDVLKQTFYSTELLR